MPLGIVIFTVSPSDLPCGQNWLRRMTPSIVSKPVRAMGRLLLNVLVQLVDLVPDGSPLPAKDEQPASTLLSPPKPYRKPSSRQPFAANSGTNSAGMNKRSSGCGIL